MKIPFLGLIILIFIWGGTGFFAIQAFKKRGKGKDAKKD